MHLGDCGDLSIGDIDARSDPLGGGCQISVGLGCALVEGMCPPGEPVADVVPESQKTRLSATCRQPGNSVAKLGERDG